MNEPVLSTKIEKSYWVFRFCLKLGWNGAEYSTVYFAVYKIFLLRQPRKRHQRKLDKKPCLLVRGALDKMFFDEYALT